MEPSSLAPVSQALTRMGRVLFSPFLFGRWAKLALGDAVAFFCEGPLLFLLFFYVLLFGFQIVVIIINANSTNPTSPFYSLENFSNYLNAHLTVILGVLLLLTLLLFGVYVAWRWLTSRGRFMFLRMAIDPNVPLATAWDETAALGLRYLKFRIYYDFVVANTYLVILLLAGVIALPDILHLEFSAWSIVAIIVGVLLLMLAGFIFALVGHLLEYFIVPLMLFDERRPWALCKHFVRQHLLPNLGPFVIYFLVQILIGFILISLAMTVDTFTCHATYLFFVGNMLLLPLTLFDRYYNLYYLQQLVPEYVIFPTEPPPQYGFPVTLTSAPAASQG